MRAAPEKNTYIHIQINKNHDIYRLLFRAVMAEGMKLLQKRVVGKLGAARPIIFEQV